MTTTVQSAGAPGAAEAGLSATVEHGTEAELEQFLAGEVAVVAGTEEAGAEATEGTEGTEGAEGAGEAEGTEGTEEAGEGDGDAEDEHHDDAALPKGVQKRINKLTALRREAEEARDAATAEREQQAQEMATLRAQLGQATVNGAAQFGASRMAAMQSEQELEAHAGRLMQIKGLLAQNADGYESEDGNISLSAEDVKTKLLAIDRELMVDYPKAVRQMGQRQQANAAAATVYPDLFGKDGAPAATLQGALLHVPGLAVLPNAAFLVGDMLAGERLRNAGLTVDAKGNVVRKDGKPAAAAGPAMKAAGASAATVTKPKAPVAPPSRGGAAGPAAPGTKSGAKRGFERVAAEGTEEALMAAFME